MHDSTGYRVILELTGDQLAAGLSLVSVAVDPSVPIVLLTGPPGGGKSTVGRLVAEAFERSVHIEADVVRESIVGGFVSPSSGNMFSEAGIRQFALQREIVIHWALRKAEEGYVPVIDDAPIPPDGHFEQQYAPLLGLPSVRPVILRADGDVVRNRIRSRGGPFDEVLVTVVDTALGLLDGLDSESWHTIDSTEMTVEASATAILEHLRTTARLHTDRPRERAGPLGTEKPER